MIDNIINVLGYSGDDPMVIYIACIAGSVLFICLSYKLFDFLLSLISSLIGRGKDIKF